MKKIIIIGGGAAGMMAAATLAESKLDCDITLIERNQFLGQKVMISGGGRCNVTTGVEDLKQVMSAYPRGARFLRTPMYAFPPTAMRAFVEEHGVPLKKEADQRVFPVSNDGKDIVALFERILEKSNVKLMIKRVVATVKKEEQFIVELNTGEVLKADVLVLTPGGQAYRKTGSKGDGYTFAQALGHHITELAPSLSAYVLEERWTRDLAGLSFESVKARFIGAEKHEFTGPVLFTHRGITGPGIFALSALAAFEQFDKTQPAQLELDFFPQLNQEQLAAELKQHVTSSPKKQFNNTLGHVLPNSFARALCEQLSIPEEKINAELSKKDFNKAVQALKQLPFTVIGCSPGDEFVTAGGVELSEVDSKTMESKRCPGLYFAGEILNIDGFTGGYNLQSAWATGRAAGLAISA